MTAQHSCGSTEWYTPPEILDAARVTLGGDFDLDPCSCRAANEQHVRAARYFDALDVNSLEQAWSGRIWCNPPSPAKDWWRKTISAKYVAYNCETMFSCIYMAYSIEQVQQSQGWTPGQSMLSFSLCVPRTRVRFYCTASDAIAKLQKKIENRYANNAVPHNTPAETREFERLTALPPDRLVRGESPTHSSAIVGVGVDRSAFRRAFASIGDCT